MIEHVYRRTALCRTLSGVVVATCDAEIRDHVELFGGTVVMTSPRHDRASERAAEAAEHLEADVIVMVQGDEPMIVPEMISDALAPMHTDPDVQCVNLVKRIKDEREYQDINAVKVVMGLNGDALYFSRAPIPFSLSASFAHLTVFKQVCVIPFTREFLRMYAALPPTPLEQAESIDMLRILEHGHRVRLVETRVSTHAVDTPADVILVDRLMKNDPLLSRYPPPIAAGQGQPS